MSYRVARHILAFLICSMFFGVASLSAADLASAKKAGWLGEQPNGYLGLVSTAAPAAVKKLMAEINHERKRRYQAIAAKHGLPLRKVERMAGKKAIAKSAHGVYIRLPSGVWRRK